MRKRKICTFAMVAVMATTSSTAFAKASIKETCKEEQNSKCIVVGQLNGNIGDLGNGMSIITNQLGNLDWNGCIYDVIISENCIPNFGNPETNEPEQEKPETDKPEIEIPEEEKPGVDNPENETPEVEDEIQDFTYAEQVVKLVNEERKKVGLAELTLDKNIETAALIRSKEIEQVFSHTRPNGQAFNSVLKEQGISYKGAGENIAWGQSTPEEVMEAWMNSDGHRANILNSKFTKIGVGVYENSNGIKYWTQLFTY